MNTRTLFTQNLPEPEVVELENTDDFFAATQPQPLDDIDTQITESIAAKTDYDTWKAQLAAYCHSKGIAFPTSYSLQRAWNEEQKRRAQLKKLHARKAKLQEQLTQISKALGAQIQEAEEEAAEIELDFASMDAAMASMQENKSITSAAAQREQAQLFGSEDEI